MKYTIIIVAMSFLAGCMTMGPGHIESSELSPSERRVEAFDSYSEAKNECKSIKKIGNIDAMSGTAIKMGTYDATLNALRKKAAEVNANAFYILKSGKTGMADTASAKAIVCKK